MQLLRRRNLREDRAATAVVATVIIVALTIVIGAAATAYFRKYADDKPTAQISGIMGSVEQTFRTNLTDSDLILMPFAGTPILLRDSGMTLTIDGATEILPLSALAPFTKDHVFWRAGDEVCLAGTSEGCFRHAAETVHVTIVVGNQLMFQGDYHLRAFKILPGGGILATCTGPAVFHVVGADITYGLGGPQIPVRLNHTLDEGATMSPLFGLQPVRAGMEWTRSAPAGSIIGVRGNADYSSFHASYKSWIADPHVAVLKDGDPAPDVPAFGAQTSVETFLRPYVDTGSRTMRLAYNEAIVLFEFNPVLASPAADWQDAVVLVRFPGGGCHA